MDTSQLPMGEVSAAVSELWNLAYQPVGCLKCGQAFLAPPDWAGRLCPHCLEGQLEPQPARLRREPPELVLPFQQARADLLPALRRFRSGVWLAPDDFEPASLQQRLVPTFWPIWLVDGQVSGAWQAEIGFDYQVQSSQEFYASGGWRSQQVAETRVRWEPRLGQLDRRYNNLPAPAVSDEGRLAAAIGPSPIAQAGPYDPAQVRGAGLRAPDLAPEEAWPQAQAVFERAAGDDCQKAAGGQHLRGFKLQPDYAGLNWTQLLVPLYVTYYTADDGRRVPVYINGATGQVNGKRLASPRKGLRWAGTSLLLGVILFVLALACYALGRGAVPQLAD
ncbi:MAG: hypothetical protein LUO89_05235, partial [Methanothrix sp.]|nr:hypothetical protein [Methanothrix sp.]